MTPRNFHASQTQLLILELHFLVHRHKGASLEQSSSSVYLAYPQKFQSFLVPSPPGLLLELLLLLNPSRLPTEVEAAGPSSM